LSYGGQVVAHAANYDCELLRVPRKRGLDM